MKYVCLGYVDEHRWDALTQSERDNFVDQFVAFNDVLRKRGHLIGGQGLESARTAATIRFEDGAVSVTDGPFAETKEQLGGFVVLEACDLNHAIQLMAGHPSIRIGGAIEVRPSAVGDCI